VQQPIKGDLRQWSPDRIFKWPEIMNLQTEPVAIETTSAFGQIKSTITTCLKINYKSICIKGKSSLDQNYRNDFTFLPQFRRVDQME